MRILARPAFKNKAENPYNWLLYTHMASLGVEVEEFSPYRILVRKYDVCHLHWPEGGLISPNPLEAIRLSLGLLILIKIAEIRGTKIVWTIHNLKSHEDLYPKLEAWFWTAFVRGVNGYISLSEIGRQTALKRFPTLHQRQGLVVPHGHYREVYPNRMAKVEARRVLNLPPDAKVIAFVGQIRPYKNVPHLIKIFQDLPDPQSLLLVAGRPNSLKTEQVVKTAALGKSRVHLFLDAVPDEAMQLYLNAADLVVLPYYKILNSGSALLALSFNTPILLPCQDTFQELQEIVGTTWVRTYTGELASSELAKALDWALYTPRHEIAPLEALDWKPLARKTLKFFKTMTREKAAAKNMASASNKVPFP